MGMLDILPTQDFHTTTLCTGSLDACKWYISASCVISLFIGALDRNVKQPSRLSILFQPY